MAGELPLLEGGVTPAVGLLKDGGGTSNVASGPARTRALVLDPDPIQRREPIPRDSSGCFRARRWSLPRVRLEFDLQLDHIIPVSMGGATTVASLQLLCATRNQRKGGTLG